MNPLTRLLRAIRHAPLLRRCDWLWDRVRPGYHRVLNAVGWGTTIRCGGIKLRLPAEFSGLGWEHYEREATAALAEWVGRHPEARVYDAGSSVGLMCLVALTASDRAEVWAFDADLTSLALIPAVCRRAPNPDRTRRVFGLLSNAATVPGDLAAATARTADELARVDRPSPSAIRYVCLDGRNETVLPVYTLDGLLGDAPGGRPCLLKIDVEGAELLVLDGADRFVRRNRPVILVSVHPDMLRDRGHSDAAVRGWLTERGYSVRVLAIDHEEHWWCEPAAGR